MAKEIWCVLTQPIVSGLRRKPGLKILSKESDQLSLAQPGITSQSTLSHKSSQSGDSHVAILFHLYLRHKRSGVFEILLCLAHPLCSHEFRETHDSLASWHILDYALEQGLAQVLVRICDIMLKLLELCQFESSK